VSRGQHDDDDCENPVPAGREPGGLEVTRVQVEVQQDRRGQADQKVCQEVADSVAPVVRQAHGALDALDGGAGWIDKLHGLVDETLALFPAFGLASLS
jgi:hypothetical protein